METTRIYKLYNELKKEVILQIKGKIRRKPDCILRLTNHSINFSKPNWEEDFFRGLGDYEENCHVQQQMDEFGSVETCLVIRLYYDSAKTHQYFASLSDEWGNVFSMDLDALSLDSLMEIYNHIVNNNL